METQHIVLLDFGTKKSIVNSLVNRDCKVTIVPYNTTFEKIKELKPDGILLIKWTWGSKGYHRNFTND